MTTSAEEAPRIEPLKPPYEPEVAEQLSRWMPPGAEIEPLGLFRTMMVHGELAARMRPLGAGILGARATVPLGLRELMIDRTCALAGAEYEWGVHVTAFGAVAGLSDEQVRATALEGSQAACWEHDQLMVLRLAEELHGTSTVSEDLWGELRAIFSDVQLIELVVTAGWYHVIAYLCNGLRVQLEPWAARFPTRDAAVGTAGGAD
jgi:alkylhydroperoxidase family enzyme